MDTVNIQVETQVTKVFTLTLTEDEAAKLKGVLGNIAGEGPVNEFTDKLFDALDVEQGLYESYYESLDGTLTANQI